jgi:hypothetical protein
MKKIEITLEASPSGRRLILMARYDDGSVLRAGRETAFLGKLEINRDAHGDLMPEHQIRSFLTSVVLPQLDLFSRQIETELIEEEEVALETEAGPAP